MWFGRKENFCFVLISSSGKKWCSTLLIFRWGLSLFWCSWLQRFWASVTETAWGRAFRCYLQIAGWGLLRWTNWMISCEWHRTFTLSLSPGVSFPLVLNWGKESAWGSGWGGCCWIIRSATSEWPLLLCWWACSAVCAAVWCLTANSVLYLLPLREGSIWKSKKCCGNGARPVEFLSSSGLLDLFGCLAPAGGSPSLQMRFDPC